MVLEGKELGKLQDIGRIHFAGVESALEIDFEEKKREQMERRCSNPLDSNANTNMDVEGELVVGGEADFQAGVGIWGGKSFPTAAAAAMKF